MKKIASLRLYRGVIVLSIGLLVLLLVLAAVCWSLSSYNPKTLSLAYRIDSRKTRLFFRTIDRERFGNLLNLAAPAVKTGPLPSASLSSLPQAAFYEFALLNKSGSGTEWVIYAHRQDGHHTTLLSENDPQLFLPLGDISKSLNKTPLFDYYVSDTTKNVFWSSLTWSLVPPSDASAILKSGLAGFSSVLVTFDQPQSGELYLEKKPSDPGRRPGISGPLNIPLPFMPVLELRSTDPAASLSAINTALAIENPGLFEGLYGITEALSERFTGSRDIRGVTGDLFQNGSSISVLRGSGSTLSLLISGTAFSRTALDGWIKAIDSIKNPGVSRNLRFMKENSRMDIIAGTENAPQEQTPVSGWSIIKIGETGSNLSLTIARRDRIFILSTDGPMLKEIVSGLTGAAGFSRPGGTVDLTWFYSWLNQSLPFLAKDTSFIISRFLGPDAVRLNWEVSDGSFATQINWSVESSKTAQLVRPIPRNTGKK
jgi:hypothetical protein